MARIRHELGVEEARQQPGDERLGTRNTEEIGEIVKEVKDTT